MAKKTHSYAFNKALLDIDWAEGKFIVTESGKEGDVSYNLAQVLEEFNGKVISLAIREEDAIQPMDEAIVDADDVNNFFIDEE